MNHWRLAFLALPLALAGCGEDGGPTGPAEPEVFTTPTEVLDELRLSLQLRDIDRYAALLEVTPAGRADAGFRFYARDADEFPWIPKTGWDRDFEVTLAGNLLDPNFYSDETLENVDSIEFYYTVLNVTDEADGEIVVSANVAGTVLWSPGDGARFDNRAVMTLARQEDDSLLIREWIELDPLLAIDSGSWGGVKALYRTGSDGQ